MIDFKELFDAFKAASCFTSTIIDSQHDQESEQIGSIVIKIMEQKQLEIQHNGIYSKGKQRLKIDSRHQWHALEQGRLRLNHFTYDPQATLLFVPKEHYWQSEPYYCAADIYLARLHLEDDKIHLEWQIKGPNKDCQITTHYT